MTDIFDTKIVCQKCNREMKKCVLEKQGADVRAVRCEKCKSEIIHPADLNCLERYKDLKGKTFNVKLRMVGNSHAISIPKEIVDFMNERHKSMNEQHRKISREMEDIVKLAFEDFGRLSLNFLGEDEDEEE
jgi:hypothetical protein